jgi:hypothetical protein
LGVRGMSVEPVWRPLRDHSVSPWRTMKTRGSGIVFDYGWCDGTRKCLEMKRDATEERIAQKLECRIRQCENRLEGEKREEMN